MPSVVMQALGCNFHLFLEVLRPSWVVACEVAWDALGPQYHTHHFLFGTLPGSFRDRASAFSFEKTLDFVSSQGGLNSVRIISVWLPRFLRVSSNSLSRGGRNMAEPRFKPRPTLVLVVEEMVLAQRIPGRMDLGSDLCGIQHVLVTKTSNARESVVYFTSTLQGKKNSKLETFTLAGHSSQSSSPYFLPWADKWLLFRPCTLNRYV